MVLSSRLKSLVISLHRKGYNSVRIAKFLKDRHSYSITPRGVRYAVSCKQSEKRNNQRGKVKDVHMNYIHYCYQKNNSVTASEVQRKIFEVFDLRLSTSTIKFMRKKLGWTASTTKYCQLISCKNRQFRKKWSLAMLRESVDFEDVIFTDETTVELTSSGTLSFYCKHTGLDNKPSKEPKAKHSYKLHVWGGISYRGRTNVCVFSGIMGSLTYQEILKENLLPFVEKKFPDGYLLYQDNDRKHTSKSTKAWMEANNVSTLTVPASSPDINPIENVWASLKDFLKRKEKPKSKEALTNGIVKFWESLTPQMCGRYIDHIHKVLPEVVLNEGAATIY